MAAACGTWASKLQAGVTPSDTSLTGPDISAVFSAIHADVIATGADCMARMQSTATRISAAANGYENNESESAARLHAITGQP
jgi:hypothetical protein